MAASDILNSVQWHVSPRRIPDNAMITPGGYESRNFSEMPYEGGHTYFTPDAGRAEQYGEQMEGKFGRAYFHQVQPTGPYEPDPDDPTAFRSKSPLRVIRSQTRMSDQEDTEDLAYGVSSYNAHAEDARKTTGEDRLYHLERAHAALADNMRMNWGANSR